MQIREAVSEDFEAIVSFDHVARDLDSRREFIRRSIEKQVALVLVDEQSVLGYAVFDYAFYSNGFISMVYIAPDSQRHGYGSAMLRHIESLCKTAKLFTSTNESNIAMQALLEKLGYVRSGSIDNLDEGDPELIYFKSLGREAR